MPSICPKCGGLNPGCSVCGAPPRRNAVDIKEQHIFSMLAAQFKIVLDEEWPVQFVDLSGWNGVMDFSITLTKVQYAVIRLGYGNKWKDSRCDAYRAALVEAGAPYFGYWYVKAGENYEEHADSFIEVASEYPGIIGLEEDFEQTSLGRSATLSWILNYDAKLKSKTSLPVSPYSNFSFWAEKVAENNHYTNEQWVANWTFAPSPWMPPNWTWKKGCKWQWSADGNGKAKEYGMVEDGDNDMDLNRFYGSIDEFNARYGTNIGPIGGEPNPDPDPVSEFKMKSLYDGLYVREGPGTSYGIVGHLHAGDELVVDNIGGSSAWMQIKEGTFKGKWCAVQTSKRYMEPVK